MMSLSAILLAVTIGIIYGIYTFIRDDIKERKGKIKDEHPTRNI